METHAPPNTAAKKKYPKSPFVAKAMVVTHGPKGWAYLILRASTNDRFDLPGGKTERADLVGEHQTPADPGFWPTLSRTLARELSEEIPRLDVRDVVVIHRGFHPCITRSVKTGHAYFLIYCPLHRLRPAVAMSPLSREHIWGMLVDTGRFQTALSLIFKGNRNLAEWVHHFWGEGRKKLGRHFAQQLPAISSNPAPPLSPLAFPFRPLDARSPPAAAPTPPAFHAWNATPFPSFTLSASHFTNSTACVLQLVGAPADEKTRPPNLRQDFSTEIPVHTNGNFMRDPAIVAIQQG